MIKDSEGKDSVVIYLTKEKAIKKLPPNRNVHADKHLLGDLKAYFGETRVKVVEKSIE